MPSIFTNETDRMPRWPFFLVTALFIIAEIVIMYWMGDFDMPKKNEYIIQFGSFVLSMAVFVLFAPFAILRLNDLKLAHRNYWIIYGALQIISAITGIVERVAPISKLDTSVKIVFFSWMVVTLVFSGLLSFKASKNN